MAKLLADEEFSAAKDVQVYLNKLNVNLQLVELIMEEFDAPRALKLQADLTAKSNAG